MKNRKLKAWVLPCVYALIVTASLGTITFMGIALSSEVSEVSDSTDIDSDYVIDVIEPDEIPVVSEVVIKPTFPYVSDSISMIYDYYSKDDESAVQENSLIYYNDTYMQNTGIMYGSDDEFDVIAVLDGEVKNIAEDDVLGTVIEITHTNDYSSFYYLVEDVTLSIGDTVTAGQVIASASSASLDNAKEYNLLFEIYYQGKTIDPNTFYEIDLN